MFDPPFFFLNFQVLISKLGVVGVTIGGTGTIEFFLVAGWLAIDEQVNYLVCNFCDSCCCCCCCCWTGLVAVSARWQPGLVPVPCCFTTADDEDSSSRLVGAGRCCCCRIHRGVAELVVIGCCYLVVVVVVGRLMVPRSRIVTTPNSVTSTEGRLSAEIVETAGTRSTVNSDANYSGFETPIKL